jgi:hypothetical protein
MRSAQWSGSRTRRLMRKRSGLRSCAGWYAWPRFPPVRCCRFRLTAARWGCGGAADSANASAAKHCSGTWQRRRVLGRQCLASRLPGLYYCIRPTAEVFWSRFGGTESAEFRDSRSDRWARGRQDSALYGRPAPRCTARRTSPRRENHPGARRTARDRTPLGPPAAHTKNRRPTTTSARPLCQPVDCSPAAWVCAVARSAPGHPTWDGGAAYPELSAPDTHVRLFYAAAQHGPASRSGCSAARWE